MGWRSGRTRKLDHCRLSGRLDTPYRPQAYLGVYGRVVTIDPIEGCGLAKGQTPSDRGTQSHGSHEMAGLPTKPGYPPKWVGAQSAGTRECDGRPELRLPGYRTREVRSFFMEAAG